MKDIKQSITFVKGTADKKVGIFKKEKVVVYITVKAVNYPANNVYTEYELDQLTDLGVNYEILYKSHK